LLHDRVDLLIVLGDRIVHAPKAGRARHLRAQGFQNGQNRHLRTQRLGERQTLFKTLAGKLGAIGGDQNMPVHWSLPWNVSEYAWSCCSSTSSVPVKMVFDLPQTLPKQVSGFQDGRWTSGCAITARPQFATPICTVMHCGSDA